jgi:hypothetical protein
MIKIESEFVSYQIALRMKQLGFNENCYRVGNPNGAICWRFMDVAGVEGVGIDDILQVYFDERWVEIPTFSQAFRWLIPQIDDEYKVCLGENGWYIYNLENQVYEGNNGLEKLIEIVEFKLKIK